MSRTTNPYDSFFGLNAKPADLPGSSTVERRPVKAMAGGSSPSRGATEPEPEPEPEYRYPAWALSIQKANCLLEVLHELGPRSVHEVLGPLLDAQDLAGFRDALNAIGRVAMAVVCVREALPYLRDANQEMAKNCDFFLAPGQLENYDSRQRFLEVARVVWSARLDQLGGMAEEILEDEGLI